MAWTVETLNDVVDAELEELPADMLASFVHISGLIEEFGLETVLNRWERLYEALLDRKSVKLRVRLAAREILSRHSAASA